MTNPVPTHAPKTDTPATQGKMHIFCKLCWQTIEQDAGLWSGDGPCIGGDEAHSPYSGKLEVPDDLKQVFSIVDASHMEDDWWCNYSFVARLIRRVSVREANIARRKAVAMKVTAMYQRLDKHCAELESTLAAERASRLRAEELLQWWLDYEGDNLDCEFYPKALAYFAKPSVSPEQEKP